MSSSDALLMCKELNKIQGLSKKACLFQTENENKTGEMKDENKKVPTSNVKYNNKFQ